MKRHEMNVLHVPDVQHRLLMRAARAFERLYSERTEGWDEAAAQDAWFDGGEWSRPAWGRNYEDMADRCFTEVCDRFGLGDHELSNAIGYLENMEMWFFLNAQLPIDAATYLDPEVNR